MSLQHTANHLAAQGRNGDSMLMHVTPREVSGLQALAQHHGGSLTVNPQTGLPEANFLDDIGLGGVNKFVPAIAGAGLSFFSGGAIDPMTAAAMVGGLAGLSSGSLADGIQAGLGAYGGASLTGSLGAMGGAANARAAAQAADAGATGPLSGTAFSNAAAAPDVGAGFDAATGSFDAAKDFLKDNKWAIGAAALPALSGAMTPEAAPAALKNKGYIRRYEKNPVTGALEQVEAVPVDEWGDRPAVSFGGVGTPVQYADGGVVDDMPKVKPDPFSGGYFVFNETTQKYDHVDASGKTTPAAALNSAGAPAVKFGGVPQRAPVLRDPNDTRTDSQRAYDYLMGVPGAKNPMLFRYDQGVVATKPTDAIAPADLTTRTGGHYVVNKETGTYDWVPDAPAADAGLAALAAEQRGGGGTGSSAAGGGSSAASPLSGADSGSVGYQALSAYGGLAPFAPLASIAQQVAEKMQPGELSAALARNDQAMKDAVTGYAEGSMFGAPASDPSSFAGGNYGLPGSMTSATGAGIAANPMGRDPSQAQAGMGIGFGGFAGADGVGRSAPGAAHRDGGDSAGGDSGGGSTSGGSRDGASARGGMGFGGTGSGVGGDSGGGRGDSGGFGGGNPGRGGGEGGGGMGAGGARGGLNHQGQFEYHMAQGGIATLAAGGLGSLGGYSDGGQLLRGPGDGVSDSIPATIGKGRPARLADGEFVVPARIVSELGNGSTEAGAKQLYAMMARIQAGRKKTTGKKQVAKNSKAARHLPA